MEQRMIEAQGVVDFAPKLAEAVKEGWQLGSTEQIGTLIVAKVFKEAFDSAIEVSGSVTAAKQGQVVELCADGSERVIKEIEPPASSEVGAKRARKKQ